MGSFIGVNGRAIRDMMMDHRHGLIFGFEHERQRAARALAHDDDHAALASLIDRKTTIATVLFEVRRSNVPTKIGTVDFDALALAADLVADNAAADRFAEFVREHESGLVLDVQIAAELECGVPLGAIHEDRDCHEIVAERELAPGKDGARRDAKDVAARRTFPERLGLAGVDLGAAAAGAVGIAAVIGPTNVLEGSQRFFVRHARNGR